MKHHTVNCFTLSYNLIYSEKLIAFPFDIYIPLISQMLILAVAWISFVSSGFICWMFYQKYNVSDFSYFSLVSSVHPDNLFHWSLLSFSLYLWIFIDTQLLSLQRRTYHVVRTADPCIQLDIVRPVMLDISSVQFRKCVNYVSLSYPFIG